MPRQRKMKRFESLQKQKRVKRRQTRAHITQELNPCLYNIRQIAEALDILDAMITWVRLGKFRVAAVVPVEISRIDNRAADAGAVPADKFCAAMNDNINAMLE